MKNNPGTWAVIPVETLVKESHLIITGKIVSIAPTENPDIVNGAIKVMKVLKNEEKTGPIKPGDLVTFKMYAEKTPQPAGTIYYQLKTQAVWLLSYEKDKSYWANYPKRSLPLTKEPEISALIEQTKTEGE